jgi:hypothetical protein
MNDLNLITCFQAHDTGHELCVVTSENGVTWPLPPTGQAIAGIRTGAAPALTAFNGKLYIAYQGNDSGHAFYVTSSTDGLAWLPRPYIPGIQLGSAPAIAAFKGKLYVAFQANDSGHELCVVSSEDGVTWPLPPKGQAIPGVRTGSAPAMCAFNG